MGLDLIHQVRASSIIARSIEFSGGSFFTPYVVVAYVSGQVVPGSMRILFNKHGDTLVLDTDEQLKRLDSAPEI